MMTEKGKARPAGSAAERARGDSHQAGGNPYGEHNTERGGGQVGIERGEVGQ